MKEYTLTEKEVEAAHRVGTRRWSDSRKGNFKEVIYANERDKDSRIYNDINSAGGEIAASRILNIPLNKPYNNFKGADLGEKIDVKTAGSDTDCLIVRSQDVDGEVDRNDWLYVHVTGQIPNYKVWGAIRVSDAKVVGEIRNPYNRGEAWFVKAENLTEHY
jgi:hypothetical protein